jgi:hypothetical protein
MYSERLKATTLNARSKVRVCIELRFRLAPVVRISPVADKALDIVQRGSIVPACTFELIVGKLRLREARLEVLNRLIRHRDCERAYICHGQLVAASMKSYLDFVAGFTKSDL